MRRSCTGLAIALLVTLSPCWLAITAAGSLPANDPALTLAGRIDYHIEAVWKKQGVKPAAPADDAAFLRRVWLDLAGRVPPLTAARDFFDDPDPDKRRHVIGALVRSNDYAKHSAILWGRQLFLSKDDVLLNPEQPGIVWLRQQIKDGVGCDRIVRTLLAPPPDGSQAANAGQQFVGANQNRAETVAAATGRLFLGVRLECAQCHNHPFAKWKREQFWQLAAFFSALPTANGQASAKKPGREITIPNSDKLVNAQFLDGAQPQFKEGVRGPEVLADWLVRRDNPWFARAAVNRIWSRCFGTGLVEPADDMRPGNLPSHPELLDELAQAFVTSGFDERFLVEAFLNSKTYQLSSAAPGDVAPSGDRATTTGLSSATPSGSTNPRLFTRAAVRGLTAEQVFDSLAEVTGTAGRNSRRGEFLQRFTTPDQPTDVQTPVLQALYIMNGPLVAEATKPESNRWLRVLGESAGEQPERCVKEVFLTVLVRMPTDLERERFVSYIRSGGPHRDPKRAVADLFWVLLNSPEFVLNH
jgi:hypothetical protein